MGHVCARPMCNWRITSWSPSTLTVRRMQFLVISAASPCVTHPQRQAWQWLNRSDRLGITVQRDHVSSTLSVDRRMISTLLQIPYLLTCPRSGVFEWGVWQLSIVQSGRRPMSSYGSLPTACSRIAEHPELNHL